MVSKNFGELCHIWTATWRACACVRMVLQRHGENRHTAWTACDPQRKPTAASWTQSVWELVSQRIGAMCKHQVLLQIWENCNGGAWNVSAALRKGSREQKICFLMVQMLSRMEGNDWGWATLGSAIDKQNRRNYRESATNDGIRLATVAKIDSGGIGH